MFGHARPYQSFLNERVPGRGDYYAEVTFGEHGRQRLMANRHRKPFAHIRKANFFDAEGHSPLPLVLETHLFGSIRQLLPIREGHLVETDAHNHAPPEGLCRGKVVVDSARTLGSEVQAYRFSGRA